jgi:phosphoribosylformimino-5-aminoimidazole carboxamide ribotide isomerase
MEIIPAIDVIDGKCVRLSQGDFSRQTVYDEDPLAIAKQFERAGLERLHIVDLEGAKTGKIANLNVLEAIATGTSLTIDFGGGIKTDADVRSVFNAGATMASIGSIAVKQRDTFFEWLARYGAGSFFLGADVRGTRLAIDGWRSDTGMEALPFLAEYYNLGVGEAFVTDISKDGVMEGPAIGLYESIRKVVPNLKLIASGGVSSLKDIEDLRAVGCGGAIIGKAIYEGKIKLNELTAYVG